jgi:hypothetical protein
MKKAIFIALAIISIANANAQTSFSWSPNDTIVQNVDPNLYTEMLIEQVNQNGDTLLLGIEVVYNDAPATWDGMICTYGLCLGSIQPVGFTSEMSPITDTINGYTKLTVYPAGGTESMKLRVRVFDVNNPADGDTCTWIVNSVLIDEIEELSPSEISVFPNPASDKISVTSSTPFSVVKAFDLQGREVMNLHFTPAGERNLRVNQLEPGIHIINIYSGTELVGIRKILIDE